MANIEAFRKALAARVLEGPGESPAAERRAAFGNVGLSGALQSLVARIVGGASGVGDADIAAALEAGLTEDQLFELVICAAVGEATREHDAALGALDHAAAADKGQS